MSYESIIDILLGELPSRLKRLRPAWKGCGSPSGVFLAFEGIDGAGVSTTTRVVAGVLRYLLVDGRVVVSKEPTYGPVGLHIRQILRGGMFAGLRHPLYMAHLFAADRAYHMLFEELEAKDGYTCRGLRGCLRSSTVVAVDRYKYSSVAYQSVPLDGGEAPSMWWVWRLNEAAPPPHALIYLDVEPNVSLKRIHEERWTIEAYETPGFLEKVRDNYTRLLDVLEREGEITVGEDGRVETVNPPGASNPPAWTLHTPPCIYPPGRYPIVVRAYTGETSSRASLEGVRRTALGILTVLLEELLDRGLLERA